MCMVKSIRIQRDKATHLKSPGLHGTESEKMFFYGNAGFDYRFFCIHICSFSTIYHVLVSEILHFTGGFKNFVKGERGS